MTFYIGTCRYMDYQLWDNFFPARLHTTKEIIYFLQNITNITDIVEDTSPDLTNLLFGDVLHPQVYPLMEHFLSIKNFNVFESVNIEISSRKLYIYKNMPFNYHYSTAAFNKWKQEKIPFNMANYKRQKERCTYMEEFVFHELTDEEIKHDLHLINQLIQNIFTKKTFVNVITQINLKLKETDNYIPERNSLVTSLERIAFDLKLNCYNPGKYIESLHKEVFMHDYVQDNQHFNSILKYYETAKLFNHKRPMKINSKKIEQGSLQHNRI